MPTGRSATARHAKNAAPARERGEPRTCARASAAKHQIIAVTNGTSVMKDTERMKYTG